VVKRVLNRVPPTRAEVRRLWRKRSRSRLAAANGRLLLLLAAVPRAGWWRRHL